MTKSEFKHNIQRGLGSCISELIKTNNIEKYKDIVIWACSRELAYDAQCEGTRAVYLSQIIDMYDDWDDFYNAVNTRIQRCVSKNNREFMQHAVLLSLMAGAGFEQAGISLSEIYTKLFDMLMKKRRMSNNRSMAEKFNFSNLCIALTSYSCKSPDEIAKMYLKITSDIGKLLLQNKKLYDYSDFEWYQIVCEQTLGKNTVNKILKKNAENKYISAYIFSRNEYEGASESREPSDLQVSVSNILNSKYSSENLDIEGLIHDSKSDTAELSENALETLSNIKDIRVLDYALARANSGEKDMYTVKILLKNYTAENKDLIIRLVKEFPINIHTDWHSVFSAVLDLFGEKGVKGLPNELLLYMYKNTLCSFCRFYIVRELGKRHMLSRALLEECRYDCNDDIRDYAVKRLLK